MLVISLSSSRISGSMIFISKNEKGETKIDKILAMKPGDRMVTKRLRPVLPGVRAVQPGRGKHQVCKIRVVSCVLHWEWYWARIHPCSDVVKQQRLDNEARLEGFETWQGFLDCINGMHKKIDLNELYRIEFEKVQQ